MGLGIHLEFLHFNLCEIVSIFCHLYNHYYGWPESMLSLCGSRQQPYNWLLCPKWKHTLLSSSELPKHFDQINLSHFLKLFFMVSPCSTRVKYTHTLNTHCEYNIHLCFLLPFPGYFANRERILIILIYLLWIKLLLILILLFSLPLFFHPWHKD